MLELGWYMTDVYPHIYMHWYCKMCIPEHVCDRVKVTPCNVTGSTVVHTTRYYPSVVLEICTDYNLLQVFLDTSFKYEFFSRVL